MWSNVVDRMPAGLRNAVAPDRDAAAGARVDLGAKRVAGAGYDYAAVVAIARDVVGRHKKVPHAVPCPI